MKNIFYCFAIISTILITGCINPALKTNTEKNIASDESDYNDTVEISIENPTTLLATFSNDIESIVASEFVISNSVNNSITPVSAEITENTKVVTFKIPSGDAYEFKPDDFLDLYLFTLESKTPKSRYKNGNPISYDTLIIYGNKIKAELKSAKIVNETTLTVIFNGSIKSGEQYHLAKDLIVNQIIDTTTTTWTDTDLTISDPDDYNTINITLNHGSFSLSYPVIVRTVLDYSISTITLNEVPLAANTTGITGSFFFVESIKENLGSSSAAVDGKIKIVGNETKAFVINFSKIVDKNSIASDWNTTDNFHFTRDEIVFFNGLSNNTGEIVIDDIGVFQFTNTDGIIFSSNGKALIEIFGKTLFISFTETPNPLDFYFTPNSKITFSPNSNIKTKLGNTIAPDIKPSVIVN